MSHSTAASGLRGDVVNFLRIVSDLRSPTLSIVCEPCGRRGTYNVARLMAKHGDAKLPDLQTLANCKKARSVGIHDRCKVVFEGHSPTLPAAGGTGAQVKSYFSSQPQQVWLS
jgi:hypothetical protein